MKRLGDNQVQMYPENKQELYPFLFRITQEWQFLADAFTLEIPGVKASDVSAIASARDEAVSLFNEWMLNMVGQQWFRVVQRYEPEDDMSSGQEILLVAGGDRIMVVHRCEQVMAHINNTNRTLFDPNGNEIPAGVSETVELHCVIAPPRNDELRVLPLEVVPTVFVFNH